MKKLALSAGLAAALLATACNQNKTADNATGQGENGQQQDLPTLFSSFWETQSRLDPLSATSQGDNRYNHLLPNDQTKAFRDTLQTFYQDYLTRIQKFDREKLSDNDKISYDIFKYDLEQRLAGLRLNTWMIPANQFWGLPLTLGQYGSGEGAQPFKTAKDYENWLGRVQGFTVWADSAIANFRQGMKAGIVLPRALVVKMIPQLRGKDILVADPTKSLFYGPINRFPESISAADRQRLTADYQKAISTQLVPTYRKLADFLEKEYLPKARATSGISGVPGGAEMYTYYVKNWTTTDKTPEEIYKTGLAEVARIRGEMEKVKAQVGYQGDLPGFFAALKKDPRLMPYKTPQQVLDAFHAIQAKIDPNLKKMFGRTPKTPFEIRQTEAFRAASASAEYNQGSPDGSRPGIFYIPIVDATTFNVTSGMESLFLHEAIPGHHYQISLQQENKDLPKFRQFAWYGAMGEGWALYTESLGKELGLYTDPYQYMGALGDEMHRAVRLVVDTGLHTRNMSREDAIKYMLDNEAISEEGAIAEIERYMAIPGQALSYKTGALKIQELRQKYTQQLGSKFNLSNFHDELLKDGVMPLAVLERKMDAWAEKQK
ncbi:DUF885 domain-containing protein [Hymenobacter sp. BT175]|uniref:DUF885 domain-containing protein n=1 Tax=Hymenobacter translucens TaxID=2886507 RepID=UPI001D0E3D9A|nr:DUF885 domain-containing protein [Hymenobacter translucens]MCC2546598.1 DUF885 domain-containing protein [Hymenobacter translucens]